MLYNNLTIIDIENADFQPFINKTTSGTLTDIQAMICDADLLDKSYERPYGFYGTVLSFIQTTRTFIQNINTTIKLLKTIRSGRL